MDKSSNIKQKSTKIMLIVYRLFLKLAFAFLILSGVVVFYNSVNFDDKTFIFAITSSVIFAISYLVSYYLYKLYNKNKFETIKKDPLKTQIQLMIRFLLFMVGASAFIAGMYLTCANFSGLIIAFLGLCICELIFANRRLTSHLSTFCENVATGVLFGYVYISATNGVNAFILLFWLVTLILLFLQEYFYHLTNIKKHSNEDISKNELFKIRARYFLRNALLYTILYVLVAFMSAIDLYSVITSSSVATIIFQLLPLIISIITVVMLFYTTFHKDNNVQTPNYNTVSNELDFKNKLQKLNSEIVNKSYDYVVNTMNAKNGFVRKTGEDYFYHCLNTANILLENNIKDENTIATALLHDCLEDVKDCTFDFIVKLTNENVANSVAKLTKKDGVDYKNDDNMNEYLNNILLNRDATMVKIADRMHNVSTMTSNYSETAKAQKRDETKKYFIPFVVDALKKYPQDSQFLNVALNFFELI